MKNYGQMLAEQQAAREQDKHLAARQEAIRKDQNREANIAALRAFLTKVLEHYVEAIEANTKPTVVKMPREIDALSGRYSEIGPDSPQHPYHDMFKAMAIDTGSQYGLKFVFSHAHDGAGMESWMNVAMIPVRDGEPAVGPVGIETLLIPTAIQPVNAFVCVRPDGNLMTSSIMPTAVESMRYGLGAGLRGTPSDLWLEAKAKEGWRIVPIRIENAA